MGTTPEFFPPENAPYFMSDQLLDIYNKISRKVYGAYVQLCEYDQRNEFRKNVLLNWLGRHRYHMIDDFQGRIRESVSHLSGVVSGALSKCSVTML